MAKYSWYQGRIKQIIDETHTIKRFIIEIPELDNFEYKPGQFVMLDLPIDSKIKTRQYSISSAPGDGNIIELVIVYKEDGIGTHYLFNSLEIGSPVTVSSALGKFVLPEHLDRDICFICTGVGIAPFRAMYLDILKRKVPYQNIYMVFGTRHKADLCYANELFDLDRSTNNFHYIPTLSRETPENWTGKKGYVHDVYKELFADGRPAYFYICGWKAMIFEARDSLMEMGYDRKDIKYELYD